LVSLHCWADDKPQSATTMRGCNELNSIARDRGVGCGVGGKRKAGGTWSRYLATADGATRRAQSGCVALVGSGGVPVLLFLGWWLKLVVSDVASVCQKVATPLSKYWCSVHLPTHTLEAIALLKCGATPTTTTMPVTSGAM
jgi:hypothetical protein